jgi:hypothetical protein
MRYLLIFVLALVANTLHAQSLRVIGIGPTIEIARNNAFVQAIQHQVGVVLLSERETRNYQSVRNEIITYSSGYVDSFKIVEQKFLNGRYELTIDVVVNHSKISERLLSKSNSAIEFDGDRHSAQLSTYLAERFTSDRFLNTILNDYPYRAYNITQSPYNITIDQHKNAYINIPYQLTWNNNYVDSLNEAFRLLDDRNGVITNSFPNTVFINNISYHFNDSNKVENIKKLLGETKEFRIHLIVKTLHGEVLAVKCYYPIAVTGNNNFYSLGYPNRLTIRTNVIENSHISLKVNHSPSQATTLSMINRLELKIATDKECNK